MIVVSFSVVEFVANRTYVTGDKLRSIGADLLHGQEDVDLLFLFDSFEDKICRTEESTQLDAVAARGGGVRNATVSDAMQEQWNGRYSRALDNQWGRTGGHVAGVQFLCAWRHTPEINHFF